MVKLHKWFQDWSICLDRPSKFARLLSICLYIITNMVDCKAALVMSRSPDVSLRCSVWVRLLRGDTCHCCTAIAQPLHISSTHVKVGESMASSELAGSQDITSSSTGRLIFLNFEWLTSIQALLGRFRKPWRLWNWQPPGCLYYQVASIANHLRHPQAPQAAPSRKKPRRNWVWN